MRIMEFSEKINIDTDEINLSNSLGVLIFKGTNFREFREFRDLCKT